MRNEIRNGDVIEVSAFGESLTGEVIDFRGNVVEVATRYGVKDVPVSTLQMVGEEWVNEDGEVLDVNEYIIFDDDTGEILSEKKDYNLKAKDKSDKGGLTDKGRKAYNRATGSNLKRPQPGGGKRKTSYCARSKGQQDMHNIDCRKDPDKRICKARRRWKC